MTGSDSAQSLEEIVDDVEDSLDDSPTLQTVVYASGKRAYGPMLLIPALLAMGPTGVIPFLPTTCGVLIVLLSLQLIWGRDRPWLPKKLLNIKLDRGLTEKAITKGRPVVEWLSKHIHQRAEIMLSKPVLIIAALAMIALAAMMPPLEFVPFAAAAPAFAVALIATALTTRDGVVMGAGLAGAVAALTFAVWLLSTTNGG